MCATCFCRQNDEADLQEKAESLVKDLNLKDVRVGELDNWLARTADLSFFKSAKSVREWMDDFGAKSSLVYSVVDSDANQIVGDLFQNLGVRATDISVSLGSNRSRSFHQGAATTTLSTVQMHLQKVLPCLSSGKFCHYAKNDLVFSETSSTKSSFSAARCPTSPRRVCAVTS